MDRSTERYVALLRGVNVGGKNKITMATLGMLFENAGCQNVDTYIQSGNAVFSADAKVASRVSEFIRDSIANQFGFETTVVLRSAAAMKRIEAANPYRDLERSHVMFLAHKPTPERVALLDPERSTPDQFTVVGSEIYLHLPNGAGVSKLTNSYFDSKLKTVGTLRNWRTVQKLSAMMAK